MNPLVQGILRGWHYLSDEKNFFLYEIWKITDVFKLPVAETSHEKVAKAHRFKATLQNRSVKIITSSALRRKRSHVLRVLNQNFGVFRAWYDYNINIFCWIILRRFFFNINMYIYLFRRWMITTTSVQLYLNFVQKMYMWIKGNIINIVKVILFYKGTLQAATFNLCPWSSKTDLYLGLSKYCAILGKRVLNTGNVTTCLCYWC
jgi:hypothetical protein